MKLYASNFKFEAATKETAFVANMLATRFFTEIKDESGEVLFPQIHQEKDEDAVAKWAKEHEWPEPSEMLFKHVHRKEGRDNLLKCLDSFEVTGFRSSWKELPLAVVEAGECAKTLREMPLPYPTDQSAKDEKERIRREKQAGDAPKLGGAGEGSGEIKQ